MNAALHMSAACHLCGSDRLEFLRAPGAGQSVSTDGQILPVAWDKRHCSCCGLLQSTAREAIAATVFSYAKNYHFYDRPYMRMFERGRYEAYADWVSSALCLRSEDKLRVLEVGCGAGWVLERLMRRMPGNSYMGIEPSATACASARNAGVNVWNGTADTYPENGPFDVVYSINVVEHTVDPVAFVSTLATLVRDGGEVCVICPNGGMVDPEMLFVDHLFSFTRGNLHDVLAKAGVRPAEWSPGAGLLAQFQRFVGVAAS